MADVEFAFSVIIPVYNAEEFLDETIESVISQDIGFEKNIQLILVNNATQDHSGDICKRYYEAYPNNITYVELAENIGPNGARNAGIPYIKGAYVNFLDSDDKWETDAFSQVLDFFQEHEEEIDCVACRIHNFGLADNWHPLDYVFRQSRVIDIEDEYDCPQTHLSSAFLTSDIVRNNHMDTEIVRSEDTKYILQVILCKKKFGVLRESVYWYRRHSGSTMNAMEKRRLFYFDVVRQFYWHFINESIELGCKLNRYAQYTIMYDIQWRLKIPVWDGLTQEELEEYQESIHDVLAYIDDDIICAQRNIYKEHKLFCLRLKYGDDVYSKFQLISGHFLFNNLTWCMTDNRAIFNYWWHGVDKEGVMRLTGEINFPFPKEDYEIFALDDHRNRYPLSYDENAEKKKLALGQVCLAIRPFEVELPLERVSKIQFILCYQGVETPLYIHAGKFSRLSADPPESYSNVGGYLFTRTFDTILVEPATAGLAKAHKRALWRGLFRRRDKRAIVCRIFAALLRRLSRKQDVRISFGNERIV